MKTIKTSGSSPVTRGPRLALALAVAAMLGLATQPARANRIAYYRTVYNTDFAAAGVGALRDSGNGAIILSGVTGAVTRAYLYWAGPMNTLNPTANAVVTVNNQLVVGMNIGLSQDNCWGFLVGQAYRADITALVQARRNGAYSLKGFLKAGGVNVNGASLLVFFNDGLTNNNRDVVFFDGNDSNAPSPHDDDGWNVTLPGIVFKAGKARMHLHVSDGQIYLDEALVINGAIIVPKGAVFSGDTVPGANNGPGGLGRLWDIRTFDVTTFMRVGTNTLQMSHGYLLGNDCVDLVVAAIDLPVGAAPIVSNQPPTLTCPTAITNSTPEPIIVQAEAADPDGDPLMYEIGVDGAVVRTGVILAGGPPTTATLSLTNVFAVGMHVVTFIVNDGRASASCGMAVNVIDTNGPALLCPTGIVRSTDAGLCSAVVNYADSVTATDDFPGVTFVCLPPSGMAYPKGPTAVSCTAVDAAGHRTNCVFTITVVDTEPPALNCSSNIVAPLAAGRSNAVVTYTVTATDNCPGVRTNCAPPSGSTFPAGLTTVACTATDTASNNVACSFTVTVRDPQPPALVCPADLVVFTNAPGSNAVVTFIITVTDNTPGASAACSPPSGSIFPLGTNTVTCVATDAAGNTNACSFRIILVQQPSVPPLGFRCPQVVDYSDVLATNFPGVKLTCTPTNNSFFPLGTNRVTCTYTNVMGKLTNFSFNIIIVDTNPPMLRCPEDICVNADPGKTTAVVSFSVFAADDCSGVTTNVSKPSGSTFTVGGTVVTVTATDAAGNRTNCSFTVTVLNGGVVIPAVNLVRTNDPGLCSAVVKYPFGNGAACLPILCQPPSGSVFPKGVTPVQCTVTNSAGRGTNASFTVTVLDKEKPGLICPTNIVIGCISGKNYGLVTWKTAAADNCPGVQVGCVPPNGSLFTNGLTNVRCTATDTSANSTNCTFQVRVIPR